MQEALGRLFKDSFGEKAENISPLDAHGSGRRYFRLSSPKRSAVGVFGPDARENAAFLEFSRHFLSCGLPVPEIYARDDSNGIYLEQDLGDVTLFKLLSESRTGEGLPKPVLDLYEKAVRLLPEFQISAGKTLNYGFCHPRPSFDRRSMMWDLNYFKYYFLRLAGVAFNEEELERDFKRFTDFLLESRRDFFLYRDFQSRNIMILNGSPFFIDYQGGRKGPLQYDIASLLFDAKADLPFDVREKLLDLYLKAVSEPAPISRAEFMRHYHGYAYIRIMQAMGTYGLRGFYERKSHFLQSIPYAVRNLEHLLRTAELPVRLPALTGVFSRLVASSALRQFANVSLKLTVRVQSFSYKNGVPMDPTGHGGGYVFDCRALPNPGKYERYSRLDGRAPEVSSFLEKEDSVSLFLEHVFGLVGQSIENYRGRNFTDLSVAFGCTGGRHRSVYCAERLAERLRGKYKIGVEVLHREQEAENAGALP